MLVKMVKQANFFIILLLLLLECKNAQKKEFQFSINDFKQQVELKGELGKLTNIIKPMSICVIAEKNLLLLIDIKDSTFIKVYDLKTLKFIKSLVKKGAGPNDQLDCHKLQFSPDLKYLYAADRIKQKIFIYRINDLIAPSKTVLPISDISFENHYLYSPLLLNDGRVIDYSNYQPKEKTTLFSVFNSNGTLLFKKGSFPSIEKKYNQQEISNAFQGWLTLSKDGGNVLLCYLNSDYLDLYDTQGNLKKRVQGPDLFDPEVKSISKFNGTMVVPNEKFHFTYSSARMNNNVIYILYEGSELVDEGGYHKKRLFCFDNNLKPQIIYKLTKPMFAFDMDWKTGTLYGLTHKFKDNYIVKIKMP